MGSRPHDRNYSNYALNFRVETPVVGVGPEVKEVGATQHHVMSIFADSARTKMYGSLRERAGGSCRVQVTLF